MRYMPRCSKALSNLMRKTTKQKRKLGRQPVQTRIVYTESDASPEEQQWRLDRAYRLLFEAVLRNERGKRSGDIFTDR